MFYLFTKLRTVFLVSNILWLNSCAGGAEKEGQCKIECGSAKPASSDMRIRPLGDVAAFDAACTGSSIDMTVKFIVEKPYVNIGKTGELNREEEFTPAEAISILPNVLGSVITNTNNTEITHQNVHTASDKLCSDKCGVVSLDVKPMCISGRTNIVTVQAVSGGVAGVVTLNVAGPGSGSQ